MPEIAITAEYGTKNKCKKRIGEFIIMNNNFIMTNGTINGMEVFADTIKTAMELCYGDDVKVTVHTVRKKRKLTKKVKSRPEKSNS